MHNFAGSPALRGFPIVSRKPPYQNQQALDVFEILNCSGFLYLFWKFSAKNRLCLSGCVTIDLHKKWTLWQPVSQERDWTVCGAL